MGVSAGVMAGATLLSGGLNYMGSQSAANAEESAANQSNNTQLQMFNQQQANEAPYLAEGTKALGQLQSQLPGLESNFSLSDFQQNPGYQFQLQQGQAALQQSAAARGLLNSTGTMKDMDTYTQGLANTDYNNAYNQYNQNRQTNYNMLASAAGLGQTAVAGSNQAAQTAGTNISNNQIGAGNAAAAGYVGGANAIGNTLGSLGNTAAQYGIMNSLNNPSSMPGLNYSSPNLGAMGSASYGGGAMPGLESYSSAMPSYSSAGLASLD